VNSFIAEKFFLLPNVSAFDLIDPPFYLSVFTKAVVAAVVLVIFDIASKFF
jgi:hypothetical protein